MIVTDRQRRILQILLENEDGISLAEVEKRLETSRRTDIVSSLYELIQHKPEITVKELLASGRTMGQEIMGPLINVLVLIFISEALPETILYFRDNNTIATTFNFTMSLGATQSAVSAIGIVLTIVFASLCSLLFLKKPQKGGKQE